MRTAGTGRSAARWLLLIVAAAGLLAACSEEQPQGFEAPADNATTVAAVDLSGISFDVHQEPG